MPRATGDFAMHEPDANLDISALSSPSVADGSLALTGQALGTVGPYRLIQRIGTGGMGEVWLAEQKEPVHRRVALKLIKAGMDTGEVVARFQAERQALALMDHPNIAKVFEAGATPQGRPYFVMEHISGIPITDYCDQHKMTLRERLGLFVHVCEGVQHAHQKAIIHRDLKPSNILVGEVDGKPLPRIIDFGVAKATSLEMTAESLFTKTGMMLGTPAYMSPEQAGSTGLDVDTRTDVYSLGVVLYELLAGARPLDFPKLAFDKILRRLEEDEAPPPSTKVRTLGEQSAATAQNRSSDPLTLARQLRGELDVITLKAIEKDRARRYVTPSELAADILRYLNNEEVLAVPPSALYRARKFARRHRWGLVTACAFVIVCLTAAAISIRQSVRANKEAAVAQAVNDFLQNDLLAQASAAAQSGPRTKPDPDLKVRTALDRAAARVGGTFDRQPEEEAAIRDTIGHAYVDLGLYPQARKQLERTLELRRRVLGAENAKTLKTAELLGYTMSRQGKDAEAETLLAQTLAIQRRVLGSEHPNTLATMNDLAGVYNAQSKLTQSETLQSQALDIRRRVLGAQHPATLTSAQNLANCYRDEGKYKQAEALDLQTLEIRKRVIGPEHPDTLMSMTSLANCYEDEGKYPEGEALHRQTLEIRKRVLGPEHPDTLDSMANLANFYTETGKNGEAEILNRQVLEAIRRVRGPEHSHTLGVMSNLAGNYLSEGKYAQGQALANQTLAIQRRVLGPEHLHTLISMHSLADAYTYQGNYAQAEKLFRSTLESARRTLGMEHPTTLSVLSDFAFMYQRQGKYSLAETYRAEALSEQRRASGSENADTMEAAAGLALAYQSEGKFPDSEPLAREALAFYRKNQPDDWQRFRAESLLGASLAGQKRYAEAEPLLLEGYQGMAARKDRIGVPNYYHLDHAMEWIIQFYKASGQPRKAAEWKAKSQRQSPVRTS